MDEAVQRQVRAHAYAADVTAAGWIQPSHTSAECIDKVQQTWAERSIADRLRVLKTWRQMMAGASEALTAAIAAHPVRTSADVRVSEVLPLLAACEYLEDNAAKILSARLPGRSGLPVWLNGVKSEIYRVALGRVLVIGPSNYPLLLPGVQVLQALVAGNAVTWKPGRGGRVVARVVADALVEAGLPPELLSVTEESVEAGLTAIDEGVDKVFFTGSAQSGREVMRRLAETGTPSVMELSGCSSVVVMPTAELGRVAAAVAFGMRLNGSATCMAPRRLIVMGTTTGRRKALVERLERELASVCPVRLEPRVQSLMTEQVDEARAHGATVRGRLAEEGEGQGPLVLVNVTPEMRIAQSDLFAPVLSVIDVRDNDGAVAAEGVCPFALSVSIFGGELLARRLGERLAVGTVMINDLIVPTADPRVPFGGRRKSGFGVTRGAEGLLEMTAVKTVLVRRGSSQRHYEVTGQDHIGMFDGLIMAGHGATWMERWRGLRRMAGAARRLFAAAQVQPKPTRANKGQDDGV